MNDLAEGLELLATRLDALEKRVAALERPHAEIEAPSLLAAKPAPIKVSAEPGTGSATNYFAVVGTAMLGIAGAYLLRAIAASGSVPAAVMAAFGIAYAVGWLIWAARMPAASTFASVTYAVTASAILVPMLWEQALRFKALPPAGSAFALAGFVVAALLTTRGRAQSAVVAVAEVAAAGAALALAVATHAMAPFIAVLLAIAAICEWETGRGHRQSMRPLVDAIADVGVWALIYVYGGPANARAEYPALGPGVLVALPCALFMIHSVSLGAKATVLKQSVTGFEAAQALVAFALSAASVLVFAPYSAVIGMAAVCLALSAVCYAASLGRFRRDASRRNFIVFSAWGAGLLLAGTYWSLPAGWMAGLMGVAAVAGVVLGARDGYDTLRWHGVLFLVAGGIASGLFEGGGRALIGSIPPGPGWTVLFVSACAVLCYALTREQTGAERRQQVLCTLLMLTAAFAATVLLVQESMALASIAVPLDGPHVAFLRTLVLCAMAMGLAFGGARWGRVAMTRAAYVALAFVAAKLLFEDLRRGRLEFISGSIFLFAVTLIGVPRLARMHRRRLGADSTGY